MVSWVRRMDYFSKKQELLSWSDLRPVKVLQVSKPLCAFRSQGYFCWRWGKVESILTGCLNAMFLETDLEPFYFSKLSGIIFSPLNCAEGEVFCPRTMDTLCKISSICEIQAGREMSVTASLLSCDGLLIKEGRRQKKKPKLQRKTLADAR